MNELITKVFVEQFYVGAHKFRVGYLGFKSFASKYADFLSP